MRSSLPPVRQEKERDAQEDVRERAASQQPHPRALSATSERNEADRKEADFHSAEPDLGAENVMQPDVKRHAIAYAERIADCLAEAAGLSLSVQDDLRFAFFSGRENPFSAVGSAGAAGQPPVDIKAHADAIRASQTSTTTTASTRSHIIGRMRRLATVDQSLAENLCTLIRSWSPTSPAEVATAPRSGSRTQRVVGRPLFAKMLLAGFGPTSRLLEDQQAMERGAWSSPNDLVATAPFLPPPRSFTSKNTTSSSDVESGDAAAGAPAEVVGFGGGHGAGLQLHCGSRSSPSSAVIMSVGGGSGGGFDAQTHGGGGGAGIQIFLPLVQNESPSPGAAAQLLSAPRWIRFSLGGGGGCGTLSTKDIVTNKPNFSRASVNHLGGVLRVNETLSCGLRPDHRITTRASREKVGAVLQSFVRKNCDQLWIHGGGGGGGGGFVGSNGEGDHAAQSQHSAQGNSSWSNLNEMNKNRREAEDEDYTPATGAFRLGYGFFFYANLTSGVDDMRLEDRNSDHRGEQELLLATPPSTNSAIITPAPAPAPSARPTQEQGGPQGQQPREFDFTLASWHAVLDDAEKQLLDDHVAEPKPDPRKIEPPTPKPWWKHLPPQALQSMLRRKGLEKAQSWQFMNVEENSNATTLPEKAWIDEGLLFASDADAMEYFSGVISSSAEDGEAKRRRNLTTKRTMNMEEEKFLYASELLVPDLGFGLAAAAAAETDRDKAGPAPAVTSFDTKVLPGLYQLQHSSAQPSIAMPTSAASSPASFIPNMPATASGSGREDESSVFAHPSAEDLFMEAQQVIKGLPPVTKFASEATGSLTMTTVLLLDLWPEPFSAGCLVFLASFFVAFCRRLCNRGEIFGGDADGGTGGNRIF